MLYPKVCRPVFHFVEIEHGLQQSHSKLRMGQLMQIAAWTGLTARQGKKGQTCQIPQPAPRTTTHQKEVTVRLDQGIHLFGVESGAPKCMCSKKGASVQVRSVTGILYLI